MAIAVTGRTRGSLDRRTGYCSARSMFNFKSYAQQPTSEVLARIWWGAAEGGASCRHGETWYRLAAASQLEDFFREL
jgi:hypothetical protein